MAFEWTDRVNDVDDVDAKDVNTLAAGVQEAIAKADTNSENIETKEDKSNKVTSISDESTDTQYPSAKAVNDKLKNKADTSTVNTELEKKQDVSNMVQDVNQEEVNPYTHYPSQMALKNALNQQLSFFSNQLTNKENVSNKANDLTNVDDEHYPTTKLLSDELDKKQSSIYKVSDLMSDSVPGGSPLYPAAHAVQDLVESTESISANSFSNALKGKKTGSVLRMDDVAPAVDSSMKGGYSEEHSPSISAHVYSKNLIPSGKGDSTTKTVNGITFKRQSDGSVVANGTATDRASYSLFNNTQAYTISAGNYFLSGCPKQTPTNCNIGILVGGTVYSDSGNGKLVSVPTDSTLKAIVLYVFAGTTVSNLVFRPQLELGSTATEYTDYVDVTGAVLKSQGKNLIPKGKGDSTTKTVNGITFKRQSDGSVVANGTATAVAKYYLVKDSDNYTIPKGNYFMSGCPSGSTGENYVLYCHGSAAGISMDSGNGRVVGFLTDTKLTDISIVINSGTTVSNLVFRPQLELGTEATEYEPYSYSRSYYVESDGSIAGGVNSISPTTTLTTDKENTVIVAEYNRDINKAFSELEELDGATIPRYGVKFGGSANSGATVQRLYNAVGLTANVGTDTETATNDFDNIYPWSGRKRCCGYWDENGSFVVNAYEGEPGYTTDGSNGEVWVETPLFYYKHTYGDDGSEEIVITSHPIGGFEPSPIHINADGSLSQKAYTAAYPMAVVDNKPTSRSGVYTPIMSLNSGMTNARLMGEKYTTTTTAEQYVKCLLMWVEFATRDIQTKMKGCSSLSYSADHKATVAEEAANRIIISKNYASAYVVGQGIAIGTALGSTNVANNRTVTAIADYDDTNTAISFDGDTVNIAVGNVVFAIAWKTGSCDNVLTSSGSPVSNTSGKYTCIYRGEETPFGNAFEWISDVLFKREGSGTTEDTYSYDIYFLKDATQYSNGTITNNYTKLNFKLPTADGYVKKLGFDSRFPWLRIPCEAGASSSTYYADYYYRPAYAVTAASVGGSWAYGSGCGPCYWNCADVPSYTSVSRHARLSYRR